MQALSVIAAQCHLSRGERQLLSRIQLLLTLEMRWLPLLGELASGSETERVSDSPLPFFFAILRETAQNQTSFVKKLDTEFTVFSCDKWGTVLSCK